MGDLFSFRGRLNRIQHFSLLCWLGLVSVAVSVALGALAGVAANWLLSLLFTVAQLGVSARRLHDRDVAAPWVLLSFIPVVNFFFWIYLFFVPGQDITNRYGPPPRRSSPLVVLAWFAFWIALFVAMSWLALMPAGWETLDATTI